MTSRVVVALGRADQQFTMFGFAPTEQWDALEPLFEGVLASIRFFEPSSGSTPAPATTLGEEQRSEYGGFVFRPIQGYQVAEEPGMIGISAPDGDPEIGGSQPIVAVAEKSPSPGDLVHIGRPEVEFRGSRRGAGSQSQGGYK